MTRVSDRVEPRDRRPWASRRSSPRVRPAGNPSPARRELTFDAEPLDVAPRIAVCRRIRHGRTRPDDAQVVADDVRNREAHRRGRRGRRQAPALHRRQVLADRVERGDVGAALEQRVHGGALVLERQVAGGDRHQRRRAAGQQHDQDVARIAPTRHLQRAAPRRDAALVGQRMARRNPFEHRRQLRSADACR